MDHGFLMGIMQVHLEFTEGKGTAWEGGQRVPCIIKHPNEIEAGTIIDEPVMGID